MVTFGKNIIVADAHDMAIVGMAKSCEIDVDVETIETTGPTTGDWKERRTGRKSWQVSLSYLVQDFTAQPPMVGQSYVLHLNDVGDGALSLVGTAICSQCKITATKGNLATGSIRFEGVGALASPE